MNSRAIAKGCSNQNWLKTWGLRLQPTFTLNVCFWTNMLITFLINHLDWKMLQNSENVTKSPKRFLRSLAWPDQRSKNTEILKKQRSIRPSHF